jgi:hypothetical protein
LVSQFLPPHTEDIEGKRLSAQDISGADSVLDFIDNGNDNAAKRHPLIKF